MADPQSERINLVKVIVEYDVPDVTGQAPPDEMQRRRETYVLAELHAPFGWTVVNTEIKP